MTRRPLCRALGWGVAIGLVMLFALPGAAASAETSAAKVAPLAQESGLDAQTKCLALTVYWEARAESLEGQIAIAHTVLNRARSEAFPDGICGVVTQGDVNGRFRCQFHWWCDGLSDEPANAEAWKTAISIARDAMSGHSADPTGGALFFHNGTVSPSWADSRTFLTSIGDHKFYR